MCVYENAAAECGELLLLFFFFSPFSSSPLWTESEERVGFAVGLEQRAASVLRAVCAGRRVRTRGQKGKDWERNQEGQILS